MANLTARAGSSFGYWSRTNTDDEYLSALKFPNGAKIYDRMRRSDPQINAVIQAVFSPILAAKWIVEPVEENNTQAEEVAKFVEDNLFPAQRELATGYSFSTPWTETLRNILLHVPFGYMVIEKVFASVDGKIVIDDLAPRLPKTLSEFHYDKNGNDLIEIIQKVGGGKFTLPSEKCIVFTFQKEGSNAVGTSLLRPVYKPWSIKEDLEKIQAIMFERYGVGVPWATAPANTKPGDPAFDALEEALENVGVNESGYLVLPNGQEVGLLSGGSSTAPDIKSAIEYYDNQIAMAWHAMFMMLGQTTSGNRALGQTFMDFFLTTVQSIGDSIADTLNSQLIPELVQLNFPVEQFPKLKMLEIQDVDFEVIASLKQAGLLTTTEETENRLRDLLGINKIEEEEFNSESTKVSEETPVGGTGDGDNGNGKKSDGEEDIEAEESSVSHRKHHSSPERRLARRSFNETEINFGLPEAEARLDKAQDRTTNLLIAIRDKQAESMAEQIGRGKKPQEISVPHKKQMYTELLDVYKDMREVGKTQEQKNARRQGVKFAEIPTAANELLVLVEEMLAIEVDGGSNKLKSMMLEEAIRLKRLGVTGNALELQLVKYVDDFVSEATWHKMAATAVNGGWGDGINIVANSLSEQVDHQVYSAVLDDSTCDVCRSVDGAVHAPGSPDHVAPNPGCLGGDKCRCVNITFYKVGDAV